MSAGRHAARYAAAARPAAAGFTLLEVMVALAIFGLVAAAGVAVMAHAADSQGHLRGRLERLEQDPAGGVSAGFGVTPARVMKHFARAGGLTGKGSRFGSRG